MDKEEIIEFSKNTRVRWIATAVLLLIILSVGVGIRIQPITSGHLIDKTTGDYTPLALDPYYFLRVSETLLANNWNLPKIDSMRYQGLNIGWTNELQPRATIMIWEVMKLFDHNVTLNLADVSNPVVFFALGLISFFFIVLLLTKSRTAALGASAILSVIPPYLYRTLGGFADHDSIGMFGFFITLLSFLYGMLYLDKKNPKKLISGLIGLLAGFSTMFAIASWGGGAKFLFMILPIAFIASWLTNKKDDVVSPTIFYSAWIFGVLVFAPIFGFGMVSVLRGFMLTPVGLSSLLVFGYIIVDSILRHFKILNEKLSAHSEIISFGVMVILGATLYSIFIGNVFVLISDLAKRIINPFGTGRVGLTVAENRQPYLDAWIQQISKTFFYIFVAGCILVGVKIGGGIKKKNLRPLFIISFAIFIIGILFSRISSSSILNGENFISKSLFLISFLIFSASTIYIYMKSEWDTDVRWIFIAAWMIPMLLAVRSAIRVFFTIVPFVSFMVALMLLEIFNLSKKSKDHTAKIISWAILAILVISVAFTSYGFYNTINYQAKMQTPSYNVNWQNAMQWVRNNTAVGSVFLHWWDYGYWVQTGGDRPTVTDGGHANGYWDHLVGRYVLTTPYPATAKSFMKAHNVSYLLIDPSDIGKYAAYSSIANSANTSDRASYITTFSSKESEIRELKNGTIRLYRGQFVLDSDLIYKNKSKTIFLPSGKAGLGAIVITKTGDNLKQPIGIFVYNGKQYRLPIRYVFIDGKIHDFGSGVKSLAYIYPSLSILNGKQKIDSEGAIMYLSQKVKDSLVAQLYLMNDPNKEYKELTLAHSESVYPFIFSYNGRMIGPIKIWKVHLDEMKNIIARKEFNNRSGTYGGLDNLQFTK